MRSTIITVTIDFVFSSLTSTWAYNTAFVAGLVTQPRWFAEQFKDKQEWKVFDRRG